MGLRCSPGILALVIHDTPPCRTNVGRIVCVRGPLETNRQLGLPCWVIKPVIRAPYLVETKRRRLVSKVVFWKSLVEHPDAWLLPLNRCDVGKEFPGTDRLTIAPVNWDEALETFRSRIG